MNESVRKKSPRAPSISLDEAIEKAVRVYEREKRHAAPVDVVAQDLGYKSANNGAALSVLASLRYYGLVDRPEEGKLAVTKDVEIYQYAPDAKVRQQVLQKMLRTPAVFADLLDRFPSGLPSDATLRFELINRGFSPASAEAVISVFVKSVSFVGPIAADSSDEEEAAPPAVTAEPEQWAKSAVGENLSSTPVAPSVNPDHSADQIPVRLSGGRRAWLVIPSPFYSADKKRLKAQIDLLICEDEDDTAE